ncbi:MAG: single-stranded DNA-binding protein [Candidatus Kapaibacterium sp.]
MARGLNKVMLIGRIQPNDPELRYTQNGQPVCTFKLVTDESYKDKEGNMVERSEWHNIVFWGKAGEIISQYMKKGSQIYIEGRIQTRKYDDKEGQTRYITEINGSDFSFLDSGSRGGDADGAPARASSGGASGGSSASSGSSNSYSQVPPSTTDIQDDDLPF